MPARNPPTLPQKFKVAFSFAGEERQLVRAIAEAVEQLLPPVLENDVEVATVFLDEWFEAWIAGWGGDSKLAEVYREQSELVVVGVSARYGSKPWTLTEFDTIKLD
jgi:hypothetical protein